MDPRIEELREKARLLNAGGLRVEAAQVLRELLALGPADPADHMSLGNTLMAQGGPQLEAAIEQFALADALWAAQGSEMRKFALGNWGEALRAANRLKEAELKYREAIAVDPDFAAAHHSLALTLLAQGPDQYEAAAAGFGKASLLLAATGSKEQQKFALRNWADTLRKMERFAEAELRCRELVALDDKSASAHNLLGLALQGQGPSHYEDAIAEFTRASALWEGEQSDDQEVALWNWADTLRMLGRFAEAQTVTEKLVGLTPDSAAAHNMLSIVLWAQGRDQYARAAAEVAKADALWEAERSVERKFALQHWGLVLTSLEDHDAAVGKYRQALAVDPEDAAAHHLLANALATAGEYEEALDHYDSAIASDPDNPYCHHNKAQHLFSAGRYRSGWSAWRSARRAYERALPEPLVLSLPAEADHAVQLAFILEVHFLARESAEALYRAVLARWPDHEDALTGLAKLYFRWSQSERPSPTVLSRLSPCLARATKALESRPDHGDPWRRHIDLADLFIETDNHVKAQQALEAATGCSDNSPLRLAEIAAQYGVLHSRRNRPEQAVASFMEALRLKPGDLKLRIDLAAALLKQKDFPRAETELRRVLAAAPGHLDALVAHAQLCIALADAGEADRYGQAEEALDQTILLGDKTGTGSKRLVGSALAGVHYLRGYVRVKRYETDTSSFWSLVQASRDFETCAALDPGNYRARSAQRKVSAKLSSTAKDRSLEWIGTLLLCTLAATVFAFAQWDFFFPDRTLLGVSLSAANTLKQPGYYVLVTFGALVFLIAGLSLPKLLKLKVGAIELEKSSVDQIKGPTNLNISKGNDFATAQGYAGAVVPRSPGD